MEKRIASNTYRMVRATMWWMWIVFVLTVWWLACELYTHNNIPAMCGWGVAAISSWMAQDAMRELLRRI